MRKMTSPQLYVNNEQFRLNGQIPWKTQTAQTTQEEIHNLNRPVSIKEVETVVKNLCTMKSSSPGDFSDKFYWAFKKETLALLQSLFPENQSKVNMSQLSSYSQHYLGLTKIVKEKCRSVSLMIIDRFRFSKQHVSKSNPIVYKKDNMPQLSGVYPGMQGWFYIQSQ